jgi:hypothetical protein
MSKIMKGIDWIYPREKSQPIPKPPMMSKMMKRIDRISPQEKSRPTPNI